LYLFIFRFKHQTPDYILHGIEKDCGLWYMS